MLSFQVAGYDLADGEEPCFETVRYIQERRKHAEDGWVNMSGSFYNGIICE